MEILKNLPRDFVKGIYKARELSWRNFGKKIYFYAPGFVYYSNKYFRSSLTSFPSISITGEYCALKCRHCGGRMLKTMISAQTPQKLMEVCSNLKKAGALGCLISGGCLPNGSVPITRFIDAIAEVKRKLGLTIVIHTGLIDFETAKKLKKAKVDAVLIDIIGSNETIREIYRLHNASTKDYEKTLEALKRAEIPFVPHVLIGLHYGAIKGEFKALKMIEKYDPSALIFIVFFPIRGTEMEFVKPPSPKRVMDILTEARFMMPNVPMALGCARPKGKHRALTDVLAIEAGINAIAFPSVEAIERAKKLGLEIRFSQVCCSELYKFARLNV
ncbi:MAG TPA: radical SAM protein [Candidatus Bathyarchaeota archaeon]|nr:radical SAM protein [Candidatus Bathyarchaeota archaeon]